MQAHVHGTGGPALAQLAALLVVMAGSGGYVVAAHRLRRDGVAWPRLRDGCAVGAAAALVVAMSAPFPGGEFSAHMSRHVIVGMLAPLLVVAALPGTLALRALRGAHRSLVLAVLHSRPVSWLVIPPVAALVNVGSLYILYRTPLFAASQADPWLHGVVQVHLFMSGMLFTAAVCQLDPVRQRYPLVLRAGTAVAAAAAHSVLAKSLYVTPPPNTAFDVPDLQVGAQLMYYSGDVVEIAVAIVLAMTWYAAQGRALDRARRRAALRGGAARATGGSRPCPSCDRAVAGHVLEQRGRRRVRPQRSRSPLSLRERVEAASAAGFSGLGLLSADLLAAEREYGLSGIRTKDLHDGLRLVEDAGNDAAGVVIDVWHVQRAHTPVADLATVALHRIVGVELNDADAQVVGSLYEDTVHRRRYCGEGTFDLPGMITALRAAGWNGPWGVEILSAEHRALPVGEALQRAAVSARHELERAGRCQHGRDHDRR